MSHTVMVTGADGFIGSHLAEELVKSGEKVRAFCLYNSFGSLGWIDTLPPEIRNEMDIFMGDVRDPTGSGAGITGATDKTLDIGLSSRALKDDEKNDVDGTVVALDGIAIIVNKDSKVADLTVEQLKKMFTGEITNWKDVGGDDGEIVLVGREAGSGTRDGFESIVDVKDSCKYAQELTATGAVISAVEANPLAIGYASLSAVGDTVAMVTVEGVECSEDTVKDGSYKIQRPFVFVTNKSVTLSEQAQAFVDFATSKDAADLIRTAGAVPVNE